MSICLALFATALSVAASASAVVTAPPDTPAKAITILPFAVGTDLTPEQTSGAERCAAQLRDAITEGLGSLDGVTLIEFDKSNPSIQRAIAEQKLTKDDLTKGVDTSLAGAATAKRVAQMMGVELAVIGSVDRYEYDETKGLARVTMTLQSIDAKSGKPAYTVSASGEASKSAGGGTDEQSLSDAAVKDVLQKVVSGLRESSTASTPAPAPSKK